MDDVIKRGTPLDWELARRRTELARLERELAEREAALDDFESTLEAFRRRYVTALAGPHAVLDELEAQVAERASQLKPEDATKRRKAERLRERADGTRRPVPRLEPEPALKLKPPDELRKLYRELTKLAHPDLAGDEPERHRREAVMIQANAAYAEGDAVTIAYLLGDWETRNVPVAASDAESVLERLMRRIDETQGRLELPVRALEALEQTDLARLMRRAELAERQGRDLFVRLVMEVEEAQRDARKRLKMLERRMAKLEGNDHD